MIIETTGSGSCGICRIEFNPGENQYTHVGGERHGGFHGECFVSWLRTRTICPFRCRDVDPSALMSRTEQIMARLKPALENGACAAGFGFVMTVISIVTEAIIEDSSLSAGLAFKGIIVSSMAVGAIKIYNSQGINQAICNILGICIGLSPMLLQSKAANIETIVQTTLLAGVNAGISTLMING